MGNYVREEPAIIFRKIFVYPEIFVCERKARASLLPSIVWCRIVMKFLLSDSDAFAFVEVSHSKAIGYRNLVVMAPLAQCIYSFVKSFLLGRRSQQLERSSSINILWRLS